MPMIILALFCLLSAFTGGASRPDEPPLLILRIGGFAALIALVATSSWARFPGGRTLILLLLAFAATIAIQLVPLPPTLWHALPGHAPFANLAQVTGEAEPWRPISIDPDLTINSLLALLPAVVGLLAYGGIPPEHRGRTVLLVLSIGVISCFLALIQTTAGPSSVAYIYEHTTRNLPVGIMANRNHQAVFLACCVPLLAYQTAMLPSGFRDPLAFIPGALAVLLAILIVATGSRSGTAALGGAIIGSLLFLRASRMDSGLSARAQMLLALGFVVVVIGAIAAAYLGGRAESVDRFALMFDQDMRVRTLPVVLKEIGAYFPFGSGFGSFDTAFRIVEPDSLLRPSYFNHAHNDWLELILTGGLPAIIVTIAFTMWFARSSYRVWTSSRGGAATQLARMATLDILLLGLASISDYPVRTPVVTLLLTVACCWLADRAAPYEAYQQGGRA